MLVNTFRYQYRYCLQLSVKSIFATRCLNCLLPIYRQNSKPATDYKRDLQKYFSSHNLGEVPYKVAPVGSRGKEKYMATVTVEGTQFKTYPQTYNSRVSSLLVRRLEIDSSYAPALTVPTVPYEMEFCTVKV